MCACVSTTASSLPEAKGAWLRSRNSRRPWKRRASISTFLPELVVSRCREPVTVCAAPRKVRVVGTRRNLLRGPRERDIRHAGRRRGSRSGRSGGRGQGWRARRAEVGPVRLEGADVEDLLLLGGALLEPLPRRLRIGKGIGAAAPLGQPCAVVYDAQHLPPERVVEPVEVLAHVLVQRRSGRLGGHAVHRDGDAVQRPEAVVVAIAER